MKRRQLLRCTLGLGATLMLPGRAAGALVWRRRLLLGFGTTLGLQVAHADPRQADVALDAAVRALREVEAQMSLFDARSALSRLNRDGRLARPPAPLVQLLRLARDVSALSNGAFDVTVQPLWAAWAAAQRQGRLPDAAELAQARARVDWRRLEIDDTLLRFSAPGMAATLNGIAQGHAADRVRAVLAAHGIAHALVDAGEFAPLGHNPLGQRWTLGVADPTHDTTHEAALLARLLADGRCIATSGDDRSAFSADRRHHHILDPHTGDSPPALSGVTVAAPSGALADALTKVMFIAGPARVAGLARDWGVDVLWVDKAGRWQATAGLQLAAP